MFSRLPTSVVDCIFISVFVDVVCLCTIEAHPQFYLRVCSCNRASFGCFLTFARHHGVDSTGLLYQDSFRCLAITKELKRQGRDVYKFVWIDIHLVNFSVFLVFVYFSKWEVWTKGKNCVCFKTTSLAGFNQHGKQNLSSLRSSIRRWSFCTSCDDWGFDLRDNSVITSPTNTTVTSVNGRSALFKISTALSISTSFKAETMRWTLVRTWSVVWVFVDFFEVVTGISTTAGPFRNSSTAKLRQSLLAAFICIKLHVC